MVALNIRGISKSFRPNFYNKKIMVLQKVDINVKKGTIYGFLGPNGAGKTTTIKSILGLTKPDSGEIMLFGKKIGKVSDRKLIGFLPESPYYYDYLTATETLVLSGKLSSVMNTEIKERSTKILDMVGLNGKGDVLLKNFSKGMLQRIGLGQALMNDPEFIILDEPFSGLDPIGRKELRDIILLLKDEGKTVFFSSHILQDMELIVDDIGILIDGKISKEGKLTDLIKNSVKYIEIIVSEIDESFVKKNKYDYSIIDKKIHLKIKSYEKLSKFIKIIGEKGGKCISIKQVSYSLEDLFLKEIKR